jgi:hypothetical protein
MRAEKVDEEQVPSRADRRARQKAAEGKYL